MYVDTADLCIGAHLRAVRFGRVLQRLRQCAHAATDETPQAAHAADATHHVVQQHVGVPGEDGPPLVPMTPSVARASFSSSDSNQSSRMSLVEPVNILAISPTCFGFMRNMRHACCATD